MKETLQSLHGDKTEVSVDTHEEGPTRGEDWEEVRPLVSPHAVVGVKTSANVLLLCLR